MTQRRNEIVSTSDRHVDEVRDINRQLTEKTLRMRCLSYLADAKSKLLTETIFEMDQSRRTKLQAGGAEPAPGAVPPNLAASERELQRFAHVVACDLRAPLRAIEGFSRILVEDHSAALGEGGRSCLARISSGCRRMRILIDGLESFSRVASRDLTLEPVGVEHVARLAIEDLSATFPDCAVQLEIPSAMRVSGDRELLRIAFAKVLVWACGIARRGGRSSPLIFGAQLEASRALHYVRVRDHRVDDAILARLFLPLHELDCNEQNDAALLGLGTAEQILRRHGGRVWATSTDADGTTCWLALPV